MASGDSTPTAPNAQAGPSHPSSSPSQPDPDELAQIQGKMTQSRKASRRSSIFSTIGSKTAPTRRKVVSVVRRNDHEDMYDGLDEEERSEMERKKFEEEDHLAAIRDLTARPASILFEEPEEADDQQERSGVTEEEVKKPRTRQEYVWDGTSSSNLLRSYAYALVLFENQRG